MNEFISSIANEFTCEFCSGRIVLEDGCYYCTECGCVSDINICQDAEYRNYGSSDTKQSDPTRVGMPTNSLLPESSMGTVISKSQYGSDKLLLDEWRDSLHYGIKHRFKDTNIILQGGVDDVWFNTKSKKLVIADYKSQHKKDEVSQDTYFDDPYKKGYQRQLDYYAYILKGMGYKVSSDAYFYICNAKEVDQGFHGKMLFDEVLIHYKIKTDYLEDEIQKMIDVMNSSEIPNSHESCENCAYARQRSVIDKL